MTRRVPRLSQQVRQDLVVALIAALAASALAIVTLRLWRADLGMPFNLAPDTVQNQMLLKGIIEHGWVFENPSLAAPHGQELYDYPFASGMGDMLVVKGLAVFTGNSATLLNLYFLLGFPFVAAIAATVMRRLGVRAAPAVATAVLFSVLPYHFVRGEAHIFLSNYVAVPLGALLVMRLLAGDPLFALEDGKGWRRLLTRRSVSTIVICLVLGLGHIYYAAITILLLLLGGALRAVGQRAWSPAVVGVAAAGVIAAGFLVSLAPNLAHTARHGENELAGHRFPSESETYALKFAQLVLPVQNHRIPALARLKDQYARTAPSRGEGHDSPALGAFGAAGMVALAGLALAGGVGERRTRRWAPLTRAAAVATVLTLLLATMGGLSSVLAYTVSAQIRSWSRASVFLGFFGLFGVARAFDVVLGARRTVVRAVAGAAVVVLGGLDQTTSQMVPMYSVVSDRYRAEARFVDGLERRLGTDAEVYQLPYRPYPEAGGLLRMADYDDIRPYLHSHGVRWSAGAMKGRLTDIGAQFTQERTADVAVAAAAAGFDAILVDRFGYEDPVPVEAAVRAAGGVRALVGVDDRLALYDLRPVAAALDREDATRLRQAFRQPAQIHWGQADEVLGYGHRLRLFPPSGTVQVTNPGPGRRRIVLEGNLHASDGGAIELIFPDGGREEVVDTPEGGIPFRRVVELRPGVNRIRYRSTGTPVLVDGVIRQLTR